MTQFFFESECIKAKQQRKNVLVLYFILLAIYLLASIGIIIYFSTLPYASPTITLIKSIHHIITTIFVSFSIFYLGIAYKRVNNYYKFTNNLNTGLKETSIGTFFEYDETIQNKEGVDCKALIFIEWNKYKKEYFERKVLVLNEQEYPNFKEKQTVKYVTQGNVLVAYELQEEGEN